MFIKCSLSGTNKLPRERKREERGREVFVKLISSHLLQPCSSQCSGILELSSNERGEREHLIRSSPADLKGETGG